MNNQKIAVVLFNLGGPDRLESVRPFLVNLFSDANIIRAPGPVRWLLARFIAWRRTATAQQIYAKIGGGSPIVQETENQAAALQQHLRDEGLEARCYAAMRYWHPRAKEILEKVAEFGPNRIVLLPLYAQYSTTTTRSSLQEWQSEAQTAGLSVNTHRICCFPEQPDFIAAHTARIIASAGQYFGPQAVKKARLLFSAHGLPQRIVDAGDPYPQQVMRTAGAIAAKLGLAPEDWEICYQSRVGPLKWLGPSTEERLCTAGHAGAAVVLVPIAFVSEHSETLVELDMEYKHLAEAAGVIDYVRIPALGVQPEFIEGLARLVRDALGVEQLCASDPEKCAVG
jgi:protoporphyrin/coproporphyrin ferrochelatase